MRNNRLGWIYAAIFVLATVAPAAMAQEAGAPPPAGRAGGPWPGRGGFARTPSLSTLPIGYLSWALSLNDDQKAKIQAIQEKAAADLRALRQPDASGQRPDRATLMPKMQALNSQAKKDIEAVLNAGQRKQEDSVLKEAKTYNTAGIPLAVVPDLKLTGDQKKKFADIADEAAKDQEATQKNLAEARTAGDQQKMQEIVQTMQASRKATHDKALEVLTDDQKAAIAQYQKDHPRGNRPGGTGQPGGPGAA